MIQVHMKMKTIVFSSSSLLLKLRLAAILAMCCLPYATVPVQADAFQLKDRQHKPFELSAGAAHSKTIHVDKAAPPGGDGSFDKPTSSIQAALAMARPGQTIVVQNGVYDEHLRTRRGGNVHDGPITLLAETKGGVVLQRQGRLLTVDHPHVTFNGFVFDALFSPVNGALRIRGHAHHLVLKNIVLRNNARHGINISQASNVTIQDSLIQACLWFERSDQRDHKVARKDAHGIVAEGVTNLVVARTEIHDVSGDAIQLAYDNWDDVHLNRVNFWNRPLTEQLADALGFAHLAGLNPGENAVDTKSGKDEVRGRLVIADSIFHGWSSDFIANPAALNLKQNIDAHVEGCNFHNNHIALRLRGQPSGHGAHVSVIGSTFHDNEIAIRAEDRIEGLHLQDNTFNARHGRVLKEAPSDRGIGPGFRSCGNRVIGADNPFASRQESTR